MTEPTPISTASAEHYVWGGSSDGWILAPGPDLLVIEEQMPPGASETRHHHGRARQFFYVLSGELTLELEGRHHTIGAATGLEIPPGARHQAINLSSAPVRFLVISSPTTRGDRHDEA